MIVIGIQMLLDSVSYPHPLNNIRGYRGGSPTAVQA